MKAFQFIIYVKDQNLSTQFYRSLLNLEPTLNVPGMTEFKLGKNFKFGIMPENGIAKIIEEKTQHPANGNSIPRCELYFEMEDLQPYYHRAIELGAVLVSDTAYRDWGHKVCYFSDPDGHIIGFAEEH